MGDIENKEIKRVYSYGMYIYAFPVQQAVMNLYPSTSTIMLMLTAFILTLLLSILSWRIVEKPALKWKNKPIFFNRSKLRSIEPDG